MKICIVGAGAIGCWIGTKLAASGANGVAVHEVSALARGATLGALQQNGWQLETAQGLVQTPIFKASSCAADMGVQDLVVIAVKSQSLADIAPTLSALIDKHTLILPTMNGVPWWFMQSKSGNDLQANWDKPLQSIDPAGHIQNALPVNQVIGCVVHASTSTLSPGAAKHHGGQKLIVGEPSGGQSQRVENLVKVLSDAKFEIVHSSDIRQNIWYKLWGNMTMNPISAITGATVDKILNDSLTLAFVTNIMLEAKAIGALIGCPIDESPEDRHSVTAKLGAFKTSMLQDVEAGRSIELDALVSAVKEIADKVGVLCPNIDTLLGLVRVFAQTRRLY